MNQQKIKTHRHIEKRVLYLNSWVHIAIFFLNQVKRLFKIYKIYVSMC